MARALGWAAALMVSAACDADAAMRATLAVCPAEHLAGAALRLRLDTSDRPPADLAVTQAEQPLPPACRALPLPFAADSVRWIGALPASALGGDRIAITAREASGEIVGVEWETQPPAVAPPPPRHRPRRPGASLPEPPSAWVWNPQSWLDGGQALIGAARRLGVGALYISVPMLDGGVQHKSALAAFIAEAGQAGVEIHAVEGDPAMITDAGLALAIRRAVALGEYNAAHPQARLAGVQYDIEPYLLPSFGAGPAAAWMRWSAALRALSQALGEPVAAVLPFWIGESPGGSEAVIAARPALRSLTLMAYRTEPGHILDAAAPGLLLAEQIGVPANVGLENGPIAKERRTIFRPAEQGELHLAAIGDVMAVLLLHAAEPGGAMRAFRESHFVPSDPSRITFAGRTARLFEVAGELSSALTAYPAARRIAFHGLTELETATARNNQTSEDDPNGPRLENPAH